MVEDEFGDPKPVVCSNGAHAEPELGRDPSSGSQRQYQRGLGKASWRRLTPDPHADLDVRARSHRIFLDGA